MNLTGTLQKLLDEATADGSECGCQLTVFRHGKCIADLAAGWTGPEHRKKVTAESLFPVFSVGKAFLWTALHRLVQSGKLSYETRISEVWPEFGCNGKESITLRQVMSHQEALFREPEGDLCNWQEMTEKIAGMRPEYAPGSRSQYHPVSCVWIAGETLQRADGRTLSRIIRDEVLHPLALENEVFFGTTEAAETRLVEIDRNGQQNALADRMGKKTIRQCCLPSFNGIMSARGIARFYAGLPELLSPETLKEATTLNRPAGQPCDGWAVFGLGYVLAGESENRGRIFGHGGALGAEGFLVPERELAVGFTKNKINPRHPDHPLRDQISEVLELPPRHW